jgi:hypothetical protein
MSVSQMSFDQEIGGENNPGRNTPAYFWPIVSGEEKKFNDCDTREQAYSHFMSRASYYGGLIVLLQTSPESPQVRRTHTSCLGLPTSSPADFPWVTPGKAFRLMQRVELGQGWTLELWPLGKSGWIDKTKHYFLDLRPNWAQAHLPYSAFIFVTNVNGDHQFHLYCNHHEWVERQNVNLTKCQPDTMSTWQNVNLTQC